MADTTIKISEEARDRLRQLADERGISIRALVETLATTTPTEAERRAAVERNLTHVAAANGVRLTEADLERGRKAKASLSSLAERR
ncbi:hypothetical protein BIV57_12805 [Mangrovactinospora gilvigrisea]|uniref:Uncharacterized protein n=1 Tax=Mangrovactinospora gilvigrisea TaxID=1428644 RepID=A0A1J7C6C4_9ACTN|nr:hypothetical protein [Mangrovactinospora gilvigrisea]OIV37112.1 hypothetical protein BIV57_12805 [Mangrovactinospora gilvigrisea]